MGNNHLRMTMFGTGKKSTIQNRARHRPEANLQNAMLAKILSLLHRKAVQLSATWGAMLAAVLVAKVGIEEGDAILIGGAVTTILTVAIKAVAVWVSTKYIRDAQRKEGIRPDGFAGEKTRVATGTPKT